MHRAYFVFLASIWFETRQQPMPSDGQGERFFDTLKFEQFLAQMS